MQKTGGIKMARHGNSARIDVPTKTDVISFFTPFKGLMEFVEGKRKVVYFHVARRDG